MSVGSSLGFRVDVGWFRFGGYLGLRGECVGEAFVSVFSDGVDVTGDGGLDRVVPVFVELRKGFARLLPFGNVRGLGQLRCIGSEDLRLLLLAGKMAFEGVDLLADRLLVGGSRLIIGVVAVRAQQLQ